MSLLSRDGSSPTIHEQGLRDTFLVDSMPSVTVAAQAAGVSCAPA
jgi:hypothetical protein